MSTPAQKAKKTRAKNLKAKLEAEKKLSRANSRARNAENKLKYFKQGFEEGLRIRRE
jgi:hypothetical protein